MIFIAVTLHAGNGFVENRGQFDPRIQFTTRTAGAHIAFTSEGVRIAHLLQGSATALWTLRFVGATTPRWNGEHPTNQHFDYRIGTDPKRWARKAQQFERILWTNAYPKIDIAFYHSQPEARLEYDVIVHPGGNLDDVRVVFDGENAASARIIDHSLQLDQNRSHFTQFAPRIYQQVNGERRSIDGALRPCGVQTFCFNVRRFDRTKDLVVDPELSFATFLGGDGDDEIKVMSYDFVAGTTTSIDFYNANPSTRRTRDIFIRITSSQPNGTLGALHGSTIVVGGTGDDDLSAALVTVGSSATAVLVGTTTSRDFQLDGDPASDRNRYLGGASDAFITQFSFGPSFSVFVGSYLGGSGTDRAHAYFPGFSSFLVVGESDSAEIKTSRGLQDSPQGGMDGVLWAVAQTPGSTAPFTSYIGGSGEDRILSIAAFGSRIVLGGETASANFPGFDGEIRGETDAFLLELEAPPIASGDPLRLVRAERIGGAGRDRVQRVFLRDVDIQIAGKRRPLTLRSKTRNSPSSAVAPISSFNSDLPISPSITAVTLEARAKIASAPLSP